MTKQQEISGDTRAVVETAAFELYKSVLEVAYEKDGLVGVIQASVGVAQAYDRVASESEQQSGRGNRELTRGTVASVLVAEILPEMRAVLSKL
ncbi:hypothetical protein [Caballeronia sp. SBC2]|uniref:hypothetical protein n=1 Tax=Caballeronia sp. SBC2 TaxID=2705547 RepID=UPI0013EBA882|nr:hypothetical protein [Caballeronia sp. SBC2]